MHRHWKNTQKANPTYLFLFLATTAMLLLLLSVHHLVYTLFCPKNCMAMTMVLDTMQIITHGSNHL